MTSAPKVAYSIAAVNAIKSRSAQCQVVAVLLAWMCIYCHPLWGQHAPPGRADEPSTNPGWPTYRHDVRRSGHTPMQLDAPTLGFSWTWRSGYSPKPAWAGPAKQDAYANIKDLPAMRSYDLALHPIAVGDSVFFGSSADDTVYCLDRESGEVRWTYTTDGPIRVAPTYSDGHLYFGSDDGFVYCVDARGGELQWRFSPSETRRLVVNDGRLISLWPCRSGVLVDQGVAYFGNAMLPWEQSYLCAVDAMTGRADGENHYVRKLDGATMEAPMAASSTALVSPQGRVAPQLFLRSDGSPLGPIKESGGGSIVVLTADARIFHGPAATSSRTGGINTSSPATLEKVASYKHGTDIVVAGPRAYMLSRDRLIASDWVDQKNLWTVPCRHTLSLISVGDTIIAGGEDEVAAYAAADGRLIWNYRVDGKVYGLAAAEGQLIVSTDVGAVYAFESGHARWNADDAQAAQTPLQPFRRTETTTKPMTGPWLQFIGPTSAVVRWYTELPTASILEYAKDDGTGARRIEDNEPKTQHSVTLDRLLQNRVYRYTIHSSSDGRDASFGPYECDTFFNYSVPPAAELPSPYSSDAKQLECARAADYIIERSGVSQGMCLVLECGKGRLAYELARRSRLRVIGVDRDPQKVKDARAALLAAGLYGGRVSVHHIDDDMSKIISGELFNLLVCDRALTGEYLPASASALRNLLKPGRGMVMLGPLPRTVGAKDSRRLERWLDASGVAGVVVGQGDGLWVEIRRDRLPGSGEWSHLYGRADNSAFGGEKLSGAVSAGQFCVQWIGRPGPRYQPDRNGRKPSPLSTNGRLFLQGERRILAMDTCNGTILWSLELPELERFNMPRDCGNWCADDEYVYAAIRGQCWRIDAATGAVRQFYDVESAENDVPYDWGFVAQFDDVLLGSSVRQGTSWTQFVGKPGWYDATSGKQTAPVCSDRLFAVDKPSAKRTWSYQDGVIINSTITVSDQHVYFVESRSETVQSSPSRRVESPDLWESLFLVSLHRDTGIKVWEKAVRPEPGLVTFYLAHSGQRLALVSSANNLYHTYVYDAENGEPVWQKSLPWLSDNHGGHMSRPALVDGKLYLRPHVMELADGTVLPLKMPAGGCGTYACTDGALFFRSGTVTVWERNAGTTTTWNRLRPDCWLSTIPADGLLLSPEGGGGCSCGNWMETSLAFKPTDSLLYATGSGAPNP